MMSNIIKSTYLRSGNITFPAVSRSSRFLTRFHYEINSTINRKCSPNTIKFNCYYYSNSSSPFKHSISRLQNNPKKSLKQILLKYKKDLVLYEHYNPNSYRRVYFFAFMHTCLWSLVAAYFYIDSNEKKQNLLLEKESLPQSESSLASNTSSSVAAIDSSVNDVPYDHFTKPKTRKKVSLFNNPKLQYTMIGGFLAFGLGVFIRGHYYARKFVRTLAITPDAKYVKIITCQQIGNKYVKLPIDSVYIKDKIWTGYGENKCDLPFVNDDKNDRSLFSKMKWKRVKHLTIHVDPDILLSHQFGTKSNRGPSSTGFSIIDKILYFLKRIRMRRFVFELDRKGHFCFPELMEERFFIKV